MAATIEMGGTDDHLDATRTPETARAVAIPHESLRVDADEEMAAAVSAPVAADGEDTVVGTMSEQLKKFVLGSKINALYALIPFAFLFGLGGWSASVSFIVNFLVLIPLAAALGELTEDIAKRTNEATAALINVTFGNATELIISIVALRRGQLDLIKFSLIGSIIGNMLLVLGTSLLLAGLKNKALTFNAPATNAYLSTLILSCLCFIAPTAFATLTPTTAESDNSTLWLSREVSVLMVILYAAYLYFQQKTHRYLFDEQPACPVVTGDGITMTPRAAAAALGPDGDGGDEDAPVYSLTFAIVATAVVALLISVFSDFLVDSVEGAAEGLRLSKHFIGLVLVPIVGNVAEHASAVLMALKMKLDIAIGVALGSSVQIGMFVMPVICLAAWPFEQDLDLKFSSFTIGTLFVVVLLTFAVSNAGNATWLSGLKLCIAYAILCISFLHAD